MKTNIANINFLLYLRRDSRRVIYFFQIFVSLCIIVQKNYWLTNWRAIINFFKSVSPLLISFHTFVKFIILNCILVAAFNDEFSSKKIGIREKNFNSIVTIIKLIISILLGYKQFKEKTRCLIIIRRIKVSRI